MTRVTVGREPVLDEETPLLQTKGDVLVTPLPWSQFSIAIILHLAEPLTSHVIHPFAPQLVRDSGITQGNEGQVGFYVGILHSVFYLSEALTVLHWSRLSDRIGRKPVILCGLFGLCVTMICFGVATKYAALVVIRGLMGALNGNVGVIKSIVAELTDSTNISKAYAYMPVSWSTGIAIGPLIGGLLSHPVDRFPSVFGGNAFLKAHPYFLPCAVPAFMTALIWLITALLFMETNSSSKSLSLLGSWRKPMADDCTSVNAGVHANLHTTEPSAQLPLKSLLTYDVLVTAGNYASVAFMDIAFRCVLPVFLSTPIPLGGLGLSTPTIGKILFAIGCLNALQLFYFAGVNRRWGTKNIFMMAVTCTLPAIALFPVINTLARHSGYSFPVWLALGFQILTFSFLNLCYGTVFIFITAASPNRYSVGATNGFSQVTVSFMRSIGPTVSTSLFSLSVEKGYLGGCLVYYVLLLLAMVSIYIGSLLPNRILLDNAFTRK